MSERIKKGDLVVVLSGKDKGKKGKVLRLLAARGMVLVEKVNMIKRHQKPSQKFQGGIIERPQAIDRSKVMPVCSRCGKATRVGFKYMEAEEKKVRVCKKCDEVMDKV